MGIKLLLFDLDETIAPDEEIDRTLFAQLADEVAASHGPAGDRLPGAIVAAADRLWGRAPTAHYSLRIGISSLEGLWGPFGPSADPMLSALHDFVPAYRMRAWEEAVATCGIDDPALAASLASRFLEERRASQQAYPWSHAVLAELRPRYRLGMITNGAPDLQRLKLAGAGVEGLFDPLVISGDLGVGKPEAAIFRHALGHAGVEPHETVMIGDSWQRDVLGAAGVGVRPIWLDATGAPPHALPPGAPDVIAVPDLRALPDVLSGL